MKNEYQVDTFSITGPLCGEITRQIYWRHRVSYVDVSLLWVQQSVVLTVFGLRIFFLVNIPWHFRTRTASGRFLNVVTFSQLENTLWKNEISWDLILKRWGILYCNIPREDSYLDVHVPLLHMHLSQYSWDERWLASAHLAHHGNQLAHRHAHRDTAKTTRSEWRLRKIIGIGVMITLTLPNVSTVWCEKPVHVAQLHYLCLIWMVGIEQYHLYNIC